MRTALRWSLVLLAGLLIVLVATGVYLTYRYSPLPAGQHLPNAWLIRLNMTVHRVASWASLGVGVLLLAECVALGSAASRQFALRSAATLMCIALVGAIYAGRRLVWDKLALWAITTLGGGPRGNGDLRGFQFLFGDHNVRFVLLGSTDTSIGTLRTWFWLHVLALPILVGALAITSSLLSRQRRDDSSTRAILRAQGDDT